MGVNESNRSAALLSALAAAVILLGVGLRLFHVDWQSVWHDEIYAITLSGGAWDDLHSFLVRDSVHPPLHYYSLRAWYLLAGYGALQARLLSVLFGSLSILIIYMIARYLDGIRTGLIAALLLGVSQLGVMYSQEARPYAQLLFLGLCSTYLFLRASREGRCWFWWGFVLSATAMLYTHYFGIFVVAALFLFTLVHRSRYPIPLGWWIGGALIVVVLFLPWLSTGVVESALDSPRIGNISDPSTSVKWWTPAAALNWYNNGKLSGIHGSSPWWTFPLGCLLFTLPALYALVRCVPDGASSKDGPARREAVLLANALWVVPLGGVLLLGALGISPYNIRYASFGIGGYCLAVALGINLLRGRLRALVLVAIVLYSLAALRSLYFLRYKEDYRAALNYLVSSYRKDDCCVFLPARTWGENPRFWYVYHRNNPPRRVVRAESVSSGRESCPRVWLFWDKTWWLNRQPEVSIRSIQNLEKTHSKTEEAKFYGISVGLYLPKAQ